MRHPAQRPLRRRIIVAIALISQIFAGFAVHVAPAHADDRTRPAIKAPLQVREASNLKPCHESMAAQGVDKSAGKSEPAKADTSKQCCKDGSCKCATTTPAAVESRAAAAPAACPNPRADGICEAPPSRLRPSVFFRPPI